MLIAFELNISRKLLYDWKRRIERGQPLMKRGRPPQPLLNATAANDDQIAYLERLVGQLTAENHFFHTALRKFGMRTANEPGDEISAPTSANKCSPPEA